MNQSNQYVALLRGINVGGNHKVPMADLKQEMIKLGFRKVVTLLNSGNVIFKTNPAKEETLEYELSLHLEEVFRFSIPVIIRNAEVFSDLVKNNPFKNITVTETTRLYTSFLKEEPLKSLELP